MNTNLDALGLVEALSQLIPQYARRILHVGARSGSLARALCERPGVCVYGVGPHCVDAPEVWAAYHAGDPARIELPYDPGFFDVIVLEAAVFERETQEVVAGRTSPLLSRDGMFMVVVLHRDAAGGRFTVAEVGAQVDRAGLAFYGTNDIAPEDEVDTFENSATNAEVEGRAAGFLLWAVHPEYNPLLHARALFNAGHPGWAYEILDRVPNHLLHEGEVRAAYQGERQLCVLAWDKVGDIDGRLGRFFQSQSMFYDAVYNAPRMELPYLCQAEFWRRIGNEDMAARMLRTIRHLSSLHEIERRLSTCCPVKDLRSVYEEAPPWTAGARLPRLLYIVPLRPHYGIDVLYDGLCTVLGDQNVVEYPWKPTLHGERPSELAHYPCMFSRRGERLELSALVSLLREGAFDAILMGDIEQHVGHEVMHALLDAAADTPVFVVDQQDDPLNSLPVTLEFMGRSSVTGYFKREMLACHDYGAKTRPLPFAYADQKVPHVLPAKRGHGLFWAGHRQYGLRRVYLERVESIIGESFDRKYTQEEYTQALHDSRIGLNIYGFGYDTVRYWELPAHGCMLLAERLPIRIPHNFQDGESAVFFDDLPDLEEKLTYYLSHEDEVAAIALRGHEVLVRHHTASARARQLLGYMGELLECT
ncbi:MAG: glycosyltransferase family 1 protein [Candidatus Hydrogenedentes bacterium]|nr:glycosyltransferase family 1 protein [Candidatus Hydrogenedentota bacterium]